MLTIAALQNITMFCRFIKKSSYQFLNVNPLIHSELDCQYVVPGEPNKTCFNYGNKAKERIHPPKQNRQAIVAERVQTLAGVSIIVHLTFCDELDRRSIGSG